mmetsp:Transcript_169306/g.537784  ORF Transcript_169306/g.537784 Transcript_169306/m.537784 type:complete len:370 (+) Transcript_169306:115-1224(+)
MVRWLVQLRRNGTSLDPKVLQQKLDMISSLGSVRGGACAPQSCSGPEVELEVMPRCYSFLFFGQAGLELPEIFESKFEAWEVSHWPKLTLDFVVSGVPGCGTHSLFRNLRQAPSVTFTSNLSDPTDMLLFTRSILPPKSTLDEFNERWAGRPGALGMMNPTIFRTPFMRQVLSTMPALRLILIVCDPLSLAEKSFFKNSWCHTDEARAGRHREVAHTSGVRETCETSMAAALARPELLEVHLDPHVQEMHRMFGSRLLVLHQERLRGDPGEVYAGVARTLGLPPFPGGFEHRRFNSRKGHRTDLCLNASLARRLKRLLDREYRAVEQVLSEAGEEVPMELRMRRSRCDRPEELDESAPSCAFNAGPCQF